MFQKKSKNAPLFEMWMSYFVGFLSRLIYLKHINRFRLGWFFYLFTGFIGVVFSNY